MSGTEALIWTRLRGGKLDGWRFRRQKPIGPYFVDFYCPAAWLVIEVDGPVHDRETRWAYDARRKAWLEAEGYRVLTIPVSDIGHDLSQVMDRIRANLPSGPPGRLRRPPPHKSGEDLSQGQPTDRRGSASASSACPWPGGRRDLRANPSRPWGRSTHRRENRALARRWRS